MCIICTYSQSETEWFLIEKTTPFLSGYWLNNLGLQKMGTTKRPWVMKSSDTALSKGIQGLQGPA